MGKTKDIDDRFKKFGTVSFTAITRTNDFIDHLEKGKVTGTRCTVCGVHFFPPRADCYRCLGRAMEWFEVKGTGKLLTYSKLEYGPVGFEKDLPYRIALVDYGDYKVFGRIADGVEDEALRVGMEMKTEVNTLAGGQMNYVFQPA